MLNRFIFMTEAALLITLPVPFRQVILCEDDAVPNVPEEYLDFLKVVSPSIISC